MGAHSKTALPAEGVITPFRVHVPDEELDDLRRRLRATRFADDFANDDWRYGTNGGYLAELVDYWINEYDWRRWEAELNRFNHFRVGVDGIPIHFIREPGVGPAPIPLVLSHGWPWTVWDYAALIRPLADPGAHGGDPADAFEVIVPSLPGFGFSSPLRTTGVNVWKTGELWARLMRDVLGFPKFAAHGGDWGAIASSYLGHAHADLLYGIHLSMCALVGPGYPSSRRDARPEDYGPGEEHYAETMATRIATAESHVSVGVHDPQTLAWALNDSPVGLLAWLVERRRAWSDCDGDLEKSYTKDFLLTTVSIYWFTETIGTSMRYYAERRNLIPVHDRQPAVEAPTGVMVFPADVVQFPRAFAARNSDLRRWTVAEAGGHFGPAEAPQAVIDDIRSFFRGLR